MIYSRFDSALAVRVYLGEPLTLELQLTDESGSVEHVDGRVFDLVLCDVHGLAIVGASAPAAPAVDSSGPYVTATLDGDQTALLAGVTEPFYAYRERLANGEDVIVRGKIEVYPAPEPGDDPDPQPPALGTVGRFIQTVSRRATRTVAVQRGARGFTPEERLFYTRNPETGQPWIAAPTVAAMATWLLNGVSLDALSAAIADAEAAAAYAREQGDIAAAIAGRVGYDYVAADLGSTIEEAFAACAFNVAAIRQIIADTVASGKPIDFRSKGLLGISTLDGQTAFDFTGTPAGCSWDFGKVVHYHDVDHPEQTVGNFWVGDDITNADIRYQYDMWPRPNCEGWITVVDRVNRVFRFRERPGHGPGFKTADYLVKLDENGKPLERQYQNSGNEFGEYGEPYAVTPLGDGLFECAPQDRITTVLGITSKNPWTIYAPHHNQVDDAEVDVSGFVGLERDGVSAVNNLTFTVEVVDGDHLRLLDAGDYVDLTTASDYVSGGQFASFGIPTWLGVGDHIELAERKRTAAPVDPVRPKRLRIFAEYAASISVAIKGTNWDSPHFEVTLQNDGLWAVNAGGVILGGATGDITGWIRGGGAGDDWFNIANLFYNNFVTDVSGRTFTITRGRVFDAEQRDEIYLTRGSQTLKYRAAAVIIDETTFRVTLDGDLPGGFDLDGWIVQNHTKLPNIYLDVSQRGGGRTMHPQGANYYGSVHVEHCRGPAMRHNFPASTAHQTFGAEPENFVCPSLVAVDSNYDYNGKNCAVITHHRFLGPAPADFPAREYGEVYINGFDFCAISGSGYDITVRKATILNRGTRHLTTHQTSSGQDVMGNSVLNMEEGKTLRIGELNPDALFWAPVRTKTGGRIKIGNAGCHTLVQRTDASATINTIAYGTHRIVVPLASPQTYVVTRGVADASKRFVAAYSSIGPGSATYVDETTGAVLATLLGQDRATFAFDDEQECWVLEELAPISSQVPLIGFHFSTGLPGGATLTRASAGSRLDENGVLVREAVNTPRLDHDAEGRSRGLLVEAAATNLALYSQQLDQTYWAKSGVTIVADAIAAPDGTLTADKLTETATAAPHRLVRGFAGIAAGQIVASSAFVKAAERDRYNLQLSGSGVFARALFDLSSGEIVGATIGKAAIRAFGDGWWQLSVWGAADATGSITAQDSIVDETGAFSYLGQLSFGLHVWGKQIELGKPTSYIPTVAATAARAADVLTLDWSSIGVPNGAINERFSLDDGSTQVVNGTIAGGTSVVPTSLARPAILDVRKI